MKLRKSFVKGLNAELSSLDFMIEGQDRQGREEAKKPEGPGQRER